MKLLVKLIFGILISIGLNNSVAADNLHDTFSKVTSNSIQSKYEFLTAIVNSGNEGTQFLVNNASRADPFLQSVVMEGFKLAKIPCNQAEKGITHSLNQGGSPSMEAALYISVMNCSGFEDRLFNQLKNSTSNLEMQIYLEGLGAGFDKKYRKILEDYQNNTSLETKTRLIAAKSLARRKYIYDKDFVLDVVKNGDNVDFDYAVSVLGIAGEKEFIDELQNIAKANNLKSSIAKKGIVLIESNDPDLSLSSQEAILKKYLKNEDQVYRQSAGWELLNRFSSPQNIALIKNEAGLNNGQIKLDLVQILFKKGLISQKEFKKALIGAYGK